MKAARDMESGDDEGEESVGVARYRSELKIIFSHFSLIEMAKILNNAK